MCSLGNSQPPKSHIFFLTFNLRSPLVFCNILVFIHKMFIKIFTETLDSRPKMCGHIDCLTAINVALCCIRNNHFHYNKGGTRYMFNPDTWQSHAEYHINFKNAKAKFPSQEREELCDLYPAEREKLMSLDLDPVGEYAAQFYSATGRPAKNQAQILRSLVLFTLLLNRTDARLSLTAWVRDVLPRSSVLAALIGCTSVDSLPPLGSYYDFMDRFWGDPRENYKRSALLPAGKNSKKPEKEIGADGKLADPEPLKYSTKELVDKICSGQALTDNPEGRLQDIFFLAAVLPSLTAGLIPEKSLTISGDGTAVAVHANPYGRLQKSCSKPLQCPYHKDCPRHYSDPDAGWGWDSHEKRWYFGRTLYMLCYRNNGLKTELPLLMKFTSARRHDSISFLYAIDEFGRHGMGLSPANICLDSAHDNTATYTLLEHWDINALIDINSRNSSCTGLPEDISLDKTGHPLCMAGHRMCSWGYDRNKDARKYRCPLKCGRIGECPCTEKCSKSSYGRTIYIKTGASLRFHPRIPRDSAGYKNIYSERTACERVNNRVLNDYHLQGMKIRGDDHFSFWTMVICICIHLDARYKTAKM